MPTTEMDTLSPAEQNYIKLIYTQTRSGQPTSTVALAEALQIRPASVTNMLQKLAKTQAGLVDYRKHYGITLTEEGEKMALRIIRRHRLLEQFLFQVLQYPLEKIHEEAEELEHAISPFFTEKIAALMEDPAFDPHGEPIPDKNLIMSDLRALVPLSEMQSGEKGIVRLITNPNPDLLVFLQSIGLSPGSEIKITQLNPIDGTQQVQIGASEQTQVLGNRTSESIQVELV